MLSAFHKNIALFTAASGVFAVALGAIGAHLLKDIISIKAMETFKTATLYHFLHTLVLLSLCICFRNNITNKYLNYSALFFILGIFLFSFSLYFLSVRTMLGISEDELKWIGAITPFGGLSFITAWVLLGFGLIKQQQ